MGPCRSALVGGPVGQEERRTSFNSISGGVFGPAFQTGEIHGDVHFHSGAQDGQARTVWDFVSSKPGGDRGTADRQTARKQVDWPVLVGVVPQLASSFQHRALSEELGNELEREWSQGDKQSVPEASQGRRRHHVLTGLGGVGKTQLAAQLAQRFVRQWRQDRHGQLLDLLVWITADSRDAIVNGYARVAGKLGLPEANDFDGDTTANRCQHFQTWMETTSGRWLVILDDLQDPRDLNGLWPLDAGHTIVTTRRRGEPAFDGRHVIEVGSFGRQESLNYFRDKLGDRYQAEDAAKLANDLVYLPLALAQAAAYIATRGITCSEYRRRLADKRRRLEDVFPDDEGLPDEHKTTLAATWSLSIHAANQLRPVGLARPLLELASLLDGNGIPLEVFTAPPVLDHLSAITSYEVIDAEQVEGALSNLHRLSLATRDTASWYRRLRVHALVQRTTRDDIPQHQPLDALAWCAAEALMRRWPADIPIPDRELADNANNLEHHTRRELLQGPEGAHTLLYCLGRSKGRSESPGSAVVYFERLLDESIRTLGDQHTDTLIIRYALAGWRRRAGEASAAVAELEDVLAFVLARFGHQDQLTLIIRHELAHCRRADGHVSGAIAEMEELLAVHLQELGPKNSTTLITRRYLADWRAEDGDIPAAIAELEELLAAQRHALGPDHTATVKTQDDLEEWRDRGKRLTQAIGELDEIAVARLTLLAPDNTAALTLQRNLARWRDWAGDIAGAITQLEMLLTTQRQACGGENPATLLTRRHLASCRSRTGDLRGAIAELETALEAQLQVHGTDHRSTLAVRHHLAFTRAESGDVAEGAMQLEEVLASQLHALGPRDPDTLATRHSLIFLQGLAGDADVAITKLEELLAERLAVLGPVSPVTLTTRHSLAFFRGQTGDATGAVSELEKVLAAQQEIRGARHPDTLATQQDLEYWSDLN